MISFSNFSSVGSVVRLASDTNGLSSTRARPVWCGLGGGAHPGGGGGCAMAVSSDLKGHFGLRKRGHFPALDLRLSGCEVAPHENKRDPLHPL